jgi:lipoprotein-anchoring transpeptidase ErfK/SrfK
MRNKEGQNAAFIGNEFTFKSAPLRPTLRVATATAAPVSISPAATMPIELPTPTFTATKASVANAQRHYKSKRENALDIIHDNSVIVFALLFLLVGVALIEFASSYIMAHDYPAVTPNSLISDSSMAGLNKTVSTNDLSSFIASLTTQKASLNLGSQTVSISPSSIKSWLTITPNAANTEDNIHIDASNIETSLTGVINQYVTAPVNQVTITRSDSSSEVAIAGKNGTKLSGSANLSGQAINIAKNLFSNNGFNVNAPLVTLPFASVTPSAFDKLIVVDLNSKKMYMYQNGNLVNTFLVSAGKPSTPTPIGEFHIWDKLTVQTMTGPGYVQPNVPWINYFDHSGDAIHGVYWRPASVFGSVNTSHGCVGVPVATAEYIYNWAPIGTTVITTPN